MSQKEEEFPFQEFVQALSDQGDLAEAMQAILDAASQKNIYWIYSAISTIYEILKSKDEDPAVKCRCLLATYLLLTTYQYPVVTLIEVYLLPILQDIALFRAKKSEEMAAYYFQQVYSISDSPHVKKQSLEFVERATELIFLAATLKPYRTVQVEQLMQESNFSQASSLLQQMAIKPPTKWKWCQEKIMKNCRKSFIDRLRTFSDESEGWAQFLLVNLLEQIKSGKKELLQLRQLIAYGECYLTSPVINVCEDELGDLSEGFEQKRRYLGLLNELVRCGDIQAIIMIKNSQFLPAISARIGALQGHLGVAQGELLFPEISASKQIKKEFYCDFLRSLQNWAKSMPSDYDSEEFNINGIYKFLKEDKKFKFPDNLNLARFQKQAKDNLIKNKQRNDKLIFILQQTTTKQLSVSAPYSKESQLKNAAPPSLSAQNLQNKLKEAQKELANLMISAQQAQSALKVLTVFKDNWIGYLQSLNLQEADQEKLQTVVNAGQKCVEQIQLIVPLGAAFSKGKITYKQFKQRIAQSLDFHHDVSKASNNGELAEKKGISLSRSLIKSKNSQTGKNSHVGKSNIGISQFGKSKIAGRELRDRMKQKSNIRGSKLDMSKIINRSNISKFTQRSRANRSKYTQKSKFTDRSRLQNQHQIHQRSRVNELKSNIPDRAVSEHQSIKLQAKEQASMVNRSGEDERLKGKSRLTKSFKSEELKQKGNQKSSSKFDITQKDNKQSKFISQLKSKPISQLKDEVKHQTIEQYGGVPVSEAKEPRQRSSHKSNSKILARRSNQGSRLKSQDSINSDHDSVSRDNKSKSISRKIHELNRTKKMSEIQSELKKNIEKVDETIEVNGNVIKEGSLTQKKSDKRSNEFEDFKDGQQHDISSIIHSNSVFKDFHNSAQKVFQTIKKERQPPIVSNSAKPDSQILNDQPLNEPSRRNITLQESQGMIINPDLLPMRHSYHRQSNIKSTVNKKLGDNPQFKQVFSNKYEGLESRQKQERLLRNHEGLKNVIKSPKAKVVFNKESIMYNLGTFERKIQTQKKIDVHEEYGNFKSAKDLELQALEEKKNKEINMLRDKIRELQLQTMTMRTKLVAKDNELRSIKNISIVGSERGFANFTSPAQSHYDRTSQSRSEKGSLRGSSISKKGELSLFQKQVQTGFKQYLQKIKGITFRKSLLKQKCLIHKSDQIQIGCLSQSGQTVLESTLYVTPHRFDLIDFSITIIHDSNLRIKATPQHVKLITLKRQQKIHLTIQIVNLPFCLPQLQINYKATSQYSSNYHRLTFPLTFNKFCQISPLKPQAQSQNHIVYLRTDDFKLNAKVVKIQKLTDSFSSYSIVPPNKERPQWLVFAKCRYTSSTFNICMNLAQKVSWIQGFLLVGDPKPMNFFICTLKEILDASKK